MRVAGLFAGIGGIELGLHMAGATSELLCELEPGARAVLAARFPGVPLHDDVRTLTKLPRIDVLTGGFPCQDLSQAGRTAGIAGRQSGLVGEVFRLMAGPARTARWVLLENVPFMLKLDRGRAMAFLTAQLEALGYAWAYRVVDTRGFGLPQRRQRVVLLASRREDPRILLCDEAGDLALPEGEAKAFGFYWTEGLKGLGWAADAVPTLKGGSAVGIPSPPAIWIPSQRQLVTPVLQDAERLQGFPADWTIPAEVVVRRNARWKLVGNAVSVPMAAWLGEVLQGRTQERTIPDGKPLDPHAPWPEAAWGAKGKAFAVERSLAPLGVPMTPILDFLDFPAAPLSARATAGFLERTQRAKLRFQAGFLDDVAHHLQHARLTLPVRKPAGRARATVSVS